MGFKFWSRKRRYSYGGEASPPVTRSVSAQPPLREKAAPHLAAPPPSASRRASTLAPVSSPIGPPKEVRRRRSMFSFGRKSSHTDGDRDRVSSPSTGTGGRHRPRSNPPSAFERALPSAVDAPPVPPLPATLPSRKAGTGAGAGVEAPFLHASDFDVPIAVIDAEMPSPSAAPKGTPISALYAQSSSPLLGNDARMLGRATPSPALSPAPSSKALPTPSIKDLPPSPTPSSSFPSATSAGPSSSTAPSRRSSRASATPTSSKSSRPRIPSAFRDPQDAKLQRPSTSPMLDVTAIDMGAAPDVLVDMPDNRNHLGHLPIPTIGPAPPSRKGTGSGSGSVAASVPRTSGRVTNKVGTTPTAVTPTRASAAAATAERARDGDRRSVYESKRLSKRLSGALPTLPPDAARTPTGPSTPRGDAASPSSQPPSASSSKAQSLRSLKKDLPDLPVQVPQPAVRDVTESPVANSAGTPKQMGKHAQSTPPPSSFPSVFVPALPVPSASSPMPAPTSGDRVEPSTPIAAANTAPVALPASAAPATNDATDKPSAASPSDDAPAQSAPASWAWEEMECVVIDAFTPEATPKSKSTHQGAFDHAAVDRPESPSPAPRSAPTLKRSPATETLPDVSSLDSLKDATDVTKDAEGVPGKALSTAGAVDKLSNDATADSDGAAAGPAAPPVPSEAVPIVVIAADPPTPTPEVAVAREVETASSPLTAERSEPPAAAATIPDATEATPVDVPAAAALAQPEVDVVDTTTEVDVDTGAKPEVLKVEVDAEVSTAPKTAEPQADLTVEAPKAKEPQAEEPAVEEPKAEPVSEAPVAEEPKAQEPVAEPKADISVSANADAASVRVPVITTEVAEPVVTEKAEPATTAAPKVSEPAQPEEVESAVQPKVDSKPDIEPAAAPEADRKSDILVAEVSQPPTATRAARASSASPKGKVREIVESRGRAMHTNRWSPSSPPKSIPAKPARSATEPSRFLHDKEELLAGGSTSVSPSSTLSSCTSGPDTTITTPLSIHTGSRHEPDSPTKTMRTTSPPTSPHSFSSGLSTSPRSPRRYSPQPPKRPLPEENPAAIAKEKLSPARLRPVGATPRRHSHSTPPASTNANGEPSLDDFMLLFRQVGKRDGTTSIRAAVARAEGRMLAAHKSEGQ